jgi:hypothetical protein
LDRDFLEGFMAIESVAYLSRLARTGLLVLMGMLSLCGVSVAQNELVTGGSVIPLTHPTFSQIYKIDIAPNGDALFLDPAVGSGGIYQLNAGTNTFQTITTAIEPPGSGFWNEGMAMDAQGTVYITDRFGSVPMYRVPYDAATGTWPFSASGDSFAPTLGGFASNGTQDDVFLNDAAGDGGGLLIVSGQDQNNIFVIPVNPGGTVPLIPSGANAGQPTYQNIITGLKDTVLAMAIDVNGNIYFIESPYDAPTKRVTGVFFIPASAYSSCLAATEAGTGNPSTPCIAGTESAVSRVDTGNPQKFNGITLDADGNLYFGSADDSDGGLYNGLVEIPNESGSPIGVTALSFNFADAEYLSPAPVNANPTIDPRGFFWLPTGTDATWNPNGSATGIPGTGNLVLYQLGALNLGATPVGTPSATGTVFYTFSNAVSPGSLVLAQPGGGTDYSESMTNPYPPATGGAATVPCSPTTAGMQNTYAAMSSCEYWVTLDPTGTNAVGAVSGQLSMLDSSGAVMAGSTVNLTGVGEGPAAELLIPSNQTPLSSTALVSPQQVAGDSLGNSYVADSGLGEVLMFPTGSTTATAGTKIGSFKAPTGVAVDGFGDIFVGDSGSVIEIAAVQGVLNPKGTQTTLVSGLGQNLNLAVDGTGNVYAADPSNARVVRIYNPQMAMTIEPALTSSTSTTTTPLTIGTGFTKPTAVAVDDMGDLFIADGANLDEITFWGEGISATTGQATLSPISNSLASPVTGLAVDPSGSVYVAQNGGVIRIPLESTGLSSADAADIDSGGVTTPNGVGMDGLGNIYVTAASYNVSTIGSTGAGSTAVTTPNVLSLTGALVNFGLVSEFTTSPPTDVNVYNIGNEPLMLTGETYGGTDAADYSGGIEEDGTSPCALSGPTTIASGTACQLGQTVTAAELGVSQATMTVATNAQNAPSLTATLEAFSSDLLCRTLTTITLTPSTGLVYPGSATIASVTVPDPASPCTTNPTAVPEGGNIQLTLIPQAVGASETTQKQTLAANGQASFTLTGLNGGTYALFVAYGGDAVYGGSSSARTFTFPVATATPAVMLSEPNGITPINGVYYVKQGSSTTLQAMVTSTVGGPTGTVQFLNGTAVADPTQNPITLSASGSAIFNTDNLVAGTYNLTVVYGGDTNFSAVTSPVITIQVIPPSALITASPASLTTAAGTAVSTTLTIQGLEGYAPQMGVQLTCETTPVDTVPPDAECTFTVPLVNLFSNPGVPQTSVMTISSNIPTNETARLTGTSPVVFAGMFGLGLLGLAFRRRGKFNRSLLTMVCLVLLFAGSLVGFTGCTNSGFTHTPAAPKVTTAPGTYNVSVYTIDLGTNQISSLPFTVSVTITGAATAAVKAK